MVLGIHSLGLGQSVKRRRPLHKLAQMRWVPARQPPCARVAVCRAWRILAWCGTGLRRSGDCQLWLGGWRKRHGQRARQPTTRKHTGQGTGPASSLLCMSSHLRWQTNRGQRLSRVIPSGTGLTHFALRSPQSVQIGEFHAPPTRSVNSTSKVGAAQLSMPRSPLTGMQMSRISPLIFS
jgi:hypothetical protein